MQDSSGEATAQVVDQTTPDRPEEAGRETGSGGGSLPGRSSERLSA